MLWIINYLNVFLILYENNITSTSFQIFKIFLYQSCDFLSCDNFPGARYGVIAKLNAFAIESLKCVCRFDKAVLFFFNYDAIYLFHRPMVTKPISATRSNGRASAQRVTCIKKKEKRNFAILEKNGVKISLWFRPKHFSQYQYHKIT